MVSKSLKQYWWYCFTQSRSHKCNYCLFPCWAASKVNTYIRKLCIILFSAHSSAPTSAWRLKWSVFLLLLQHPNVLTPLPSIIGSRKFKRLLKSKKKIRWTNFAAAFCEKSADSVALTWQRCPFPGGVSCWGFLMPLLMSMLSNTYTEELPRHANVDDTVLIWSIKGGFLSWHTAPLESST